MSRRIYSNATRAWASAERLHALISPAARLCCGLKEDTPLLRQRVGEIVINRIMFEPLRPRYSSSAQLCHGWERRRLVDLDRQIEAQVLFADLDVEAVGVRHVEVVQILPGRPKERSLTSSATASYRATPNMKCGMTPGPAPASAPGNSDRIRGARLV